MSALQFARTTGHGRRRAVSGHDARSTAAQALQAPSPADGGTLERIALECDGQFVFVETVDIQCVEARGDLIVVHTARDSHLLRATLQSMEARLARGAYLRIHRSILVNCIAIRQMRRTPRGDFLLTLANGQQYASSAGQRHVLLDYIHRCRP